MSSFKGKNQTTRPAPSARNRNKFAPNIKYIKPVSPFTGGNTSNFDNPIDVSIIYKNSGPISKIQSQIAQAQGQMRGRRQIQPPRTQQPPAFFKQPTSSKSPQSPQQSQQQISILTPPISKSDIIDQSSSILHISATLYNNNPLIVYYDHSVQSTKMSEFKNGVWSQYNIILSDGQMPSIIITPENKIGIAYYDAMDKCLMFASPSQSMEWNKIRLDKQPNENIGINPILRIIGGKLAICYYNLTREKLYYISSIDCNGNKWNNPIQIIDGDDDIGLYSDMIDYAGYPLIVFYDADFRQVKLAYQNNIIVIDSDGIVGLFVKIILIDNTPFIVYYDHENKHMKCSYAINFQRDIKQWSKPYIIDADFAGYDITIGKNSVGQPYVIYCKLDNHKILKYVEANNFRENKWANPITLDNCNNEKRYIYDINDIPVKISDEYFPGLYSSAVRYSNCNSNGNGNGKLLIAYRDASLGCLKVIIV